MAPRKSVESKESLLKVLFCYATPFHCVNLSVSFRNYIAQKVRMEGGSGKVSSHCCSAMPPLSTVLTGLFFIFILHHSDSEDGKWLEESLQSAVLLCHPFPLC